MAKKTKSPAITEVEADGLDIDLTRSTPPPADPEVEDDSLHMPNIGSNVGLSAADAAMPETAPELPASVVEDLADPVPEAPAVAEPAVAEPVSEVAPESVEDVFAEAMAASAADPEGAVLVNPSKLEAYVAALNFGGSFHMPGSARGLTVAGTPYLAEDGRVFVRCLAHNGHQDVCVEGLLDPI